jgi:hypothetical protein
MTLSGNQAGEGLPLPFPQKRLNATEDSLKRFLMAVNDLNKVARNIISIEKAHEELVAKHEYAGVPLIMWNKKGGLFSKSPYDKAIALFNRAQKERKMAEAMVGLCMNRLSEVEEGMNFITASIMVPFATSTENLSDADSHLRQMTKAWDADMIELHKSAIKEAEKKYAETLADIEVEMKRVKRKAA